MFVFFLIMCSHKEFPLSVKNLVCVKKINDVKGFAEHLGRLAMFSSVYQACCEAESSDLTSRMPLNVLFLLKLLFRMYSSLDRTLTSLWRISLRRSFSTFSFSTHRLLTFVAAKHCHEETIIVCT